jgi:GTP-binding protein HflX
VQNALFATLDPTVRKAETQDGRIYTLSDTVGFVRHLPHELIDAFKSTLEEVSGADLIVHVVDGANSDPIGQINAVREVISEIGGQKIPEIIALNKSDIADPETIRALLRDEPSAISISVHTGAGIPKLIEAIEAALPRPKVELRVLLPFSRGDLLNRVHETGEILELEHTELGTRIFARVDEALAAKLESYSVTKPTASA